MTPIALPLPAEGGEPPPLRECLERMGTRRGQISSLPLVDGDATAGSEHELQAATTGDREAVDLPRAIGESSYFSNVRARAASGEAPRRAVAGLEAFLDGNRDGVWENSWVRFPHRHLGGAAARALAADLAAGAAGGRRSDAHRFLFAQDGEDWVRVPVSYLLKLALADAVDTSEGGRPAGVERTVARLAGRFLNDNTSPEILSFHVVPLDRAGGGGRALAREAARAFLLTQLLLAYANRRFRLEENGQRAMLFFSPLPPLRQRRLNRLISDTFYRELFVSPCLSGWERGEEKRDYMMLCHEVLTRSHLGALARLREAGILANNLVVLPQTSNLSLANNGTHVSLGSRRLTALRQDPAAGFTAAHEKSVADLVAKVVEHFLPLFVGTYSAAPFRLDFADFHPEQVLGFLPHELAPTHLRMLWRRWRGKARTRFLGRSLTPFGPPPLDRAMAAVLGLAGDLVPDFRLVDYPVALLSTEGSPALDGRQGNAGRLKRDLETLGVLDARMALYLPVRPREWAAAGFCGCELRTHSLFAGLADDLAPAVDLQHLVSALAFKLVADGRLTHDHLPDHPFWESERRQIFFAAALGLPTVYVRRDTENHFLAEIVGRTAGVRTSRRYPGYHRLPLRAYLRALLRTLSLEGRELAERLGVEGVLADLAGRLERPRERSALGRLAAGILAEAGARTSLGLDAETFNRAAERHYRETLRRRHLEEGIEALAAELARLDADPRARDASSPLAGALACLLGSATASSFLDRLRPALVAEALDLPQLRRLIRLVVLAESARAGELASEEETCASTSTWIAAAAAS